jgi:DNA uptake protein ComE-like DNA-binding protein
MRQRHTPLLAAVVLLAWSGLAGAQVGKGLLDPNVESEKTLLTLPHLTPAIAKALMAKRPFADITELNTFLLDQKLTEKDITDFYGKAFVHINLNTGTAEQFMLIPGAGARMAKEFAEYRPWKSWAQFDKEIGKYVGPQETNRFKSYLFIPLDLNAASDADILTIPGSDAMTLRYFKAFRPWRAKASFDQEITGHFGKVENDRLWRYVYIP